MQIKKHHIVLIISVLAIGIGANIVFYIISRKIKKNSNMMKISEKGKNFIKNKESLRLTAYKPLASDKWTIGYGHTVGVYQGQTITKEQATAYFESDILIYEKPVQDLSMLLNQNQFDALVSLCYNIGVSAFKNSALYAKIKANPNDSTIAAEFQKWVYSGGAMITGLVNRRTEESNMYFT